jgi:hypothetical protein
MLIVEWVVDLISMRDILVAEFSYLFTVVVVFII